MLEIEDKIDKLPNGLFDPVITSAIRISALTSGVLPLLGTWGESSAVHGNSMLLIDPAFHVPGHECRLALVQLKAQSDEAVAGLSVVCLERLHGHLREPTVIGALSLEGLLASAGDSPTRFEFSDIKLELFGSSILLFHPSMTALEVNLLSWLRPSWTQWGRVARELSMKLTDLQNVAVSELEGHQPAADGANSSLTSTGTSSGLFDLVMSNLGGDVDRSISAKLLVQTVGRQHRSAVSNTLAQDWGPRIFEESAHVSVDLPEPLRPDTAGAPGIQSSILSQPGILIVSRAGDKQADIRQRCSHFGLVQARWGDVADGPNLDLPISTRGFLGTNLARNSSCLAVTDAHALVEIECTDENVSAICVNSSVLLTEPSVSATHS